MKPSVYRIQNADGVGPFIPGFSSQWVEYREDSDNLVPSFVEFPMLLPYLMSARAVGWHHGTGCHTVEQLRRWFNRREYAFLLDAGFEAVEIIPDEILASSDIQTVFRCATPLKDCVFARLSLYGGENA